PFSTRSLSIANQIFPVPSSRETPSPPTTTPLSRRVARLWPWKKQDEKRSSWFRDRARCLRRRSACLGGRRLALAGPFHRALHEDPATPPRAPIRSPSRRLSRAAPAKRLAGRSSARNRPGGQEIQAGHPPRRGDRTDRRSAAAPEHGPR